MSSAYRDPARPSSTGDEWTYVDEGRYDEARRRFIKAMLLGAPAAAIGAALAGRWGGIVGVVPFLLWALWRYWRMARTARVSIRVMHGVMELTRGGKRSAIELSRLDRVTLETKTIHPVINERAPAGYGVGRLAVGSPSDVARLALVVDGTAIPLTEDYFSWTATDAARAELVVVLRAAGWQPRDA